MNEKMKKLLLSKGYKIWSKKDGEERIYINDIEKYLTISKTDKSDKNMIDIYHDTIENIHLNDVKKCVARRAVAWIYYSCNSEFYYNVTTDKFHWRSDNEVSDKLARIIITKLREEASSIKN
jgi:hypothetical protein